MSNQTNPTGILTLWRSLLNTPGFPFLLLIITAAVLFFTRLGTTGLASFDDCYYAEKASEVVRTGDWLTFRFADEPILENSPLFIWMVAAGFKLFGESEFWAKFPSALFGWGTVLLLFGFVHKFTGDRTTALGSALVLLTTQYFLKFARHCMFDVTLTFFILLALFAFLKAQENRGYYLLFALATALAVLTKNLLGTFPLIIGVVYLTVRKQWRELFSWRFIGACLLALALTAPWYILMINRHGNDFLHQHFVYLLFERGYTNRYETASLLNYLSYFKELFIYYQPWIWLAMFGIYQILPLPPLLLKEGSKSASLPPLLLKGGIKGGLFGGLRDEGWGMREGREGMRGWSFDMLNIIWLAVILIIMSTAVSKKLWYIMPVFVPLAYFSARGVSGLLKSQKAEKFWGGFLTILFIFSLTVVVFPIKLDKERNLDFPPLKPAVQAVKAEGVEFVACGVNEWDVKNPLAFYCDYVFSRIINEAELTARLAGDKPMACILKAEDWEKMSIKGIVLARSGRWVVVGSAKCKMQNAE